jgi:DNA-binding LytR/AlgR family response regulator
MPRARFRGAAAMSAQPQATVVAWPDVHGGNAAARRDPAAGAPRTEARRRYADCIPVRSLERIVIVRVQAIERMYLHKETLAGLCARLDPEQFLRIHRSHAVRIDSVRELVPRLHGEYLLRLGNGVQLVSGRSYRAAIRAAFGLD